MVDSQIWHFRIKTFSHTSEVGSGHKWMSYLHLFEISYCRKLEGKNFKRKTIVRSLPWQYTRFFFFNQSTIGIDSISVRSPCHFKVQYSKDSELIWIQSKMIGVINYQGWKNEKNRGWYQHCCNHWSQEHKTCKLHFFSRDLFTHPAVFSFVSLRALAPWRVIDTDLSLRTWRADLLRLRRWKVRGCDSSTFEESVQLSPPLTQHSLQGSKAGASCLF